MPDTVDGTNAWPHRLPSFLLPKSTAKNVHFVLDVLVRADVSSYVFIYDIYPMTAQVFGVKFSLREIGRIFIH